MKKHFMILAAVLLAACVSCETDKGDNPSGGNDNPGEKTEAAEIEAILPDDLEDIELNYEKQDKTLDFEWMCDDEDAVFSIVFSLDEELTNPQTIEVGAGKFDTKLTHAQLDEVLGKLGVGIYKQGNVYWAISNDKGKTSAVRSMLLLRFFGPFTDPRDGNVYRIARATDLLGESSLVWMADNMRADKYSDGTPLVVGTTDFDVIFYTPKEGDDPAVADAFGGLYTWTAAVRDVSAAEDGMKVQGICPEGWHVSTQDEWIFTINNCTDPTAPGDCFKDVTFWGTGASGNNVDKMNIPGAGYVWEKCEDILESYTFACYWTATAPKEGDVFPWNPPASAFPTQGVTYAFSLSDGGIALYPYDRGRGFSVRCVLD